MRVAALLLFALTAAAPGRSAEHAQDCAALVQDFLSTASAPPAPPPAATEAEAEPPPLFFLHVPRTAGRTAASCLLRAATPPSRRCPPSYDAARPALAAAGGAPCAVAASHADWSALAGAARRAAAATQLRRPLDRVLSAYEFAVEVAARKRPAGGGRRNSSAVSTLDVWPWSHLVPFFAADIAARAARRAAEKQENSRTHFSKPAAAAAPDPYDSGRYVMPLREFIESPLAAELLHDGATLQVLGLTNASLAPAGAAAPLRRCLAAGGPPAAALAAAAAARLGAMRHVGLTERLDDSVAALAAVVGAPLGGPAWRAAPRGGRKPAAGQQPQPADDAAYLEAKPLGEAFRACEARAAARARAKRAKALANLGGGLAFGAAARAVLDPALVARIRELNAADEALWRAGAALLEARLAALRAAGTLEALPPRAASEEEPPARGGASEAAGPPDGAAARHDEL